MATTPLPPRVGLRLNGRILPALALALCGDRAALVLPVPPPPGRDVRLVLDWPSGEVTELGVRVREGAGTSGADVTFFDVHAIDGDWVPFMAWLGGRTV